jgi:FMN phosphatase YigB (HAD superfamily)
MRRASGLVFLFDVDNTLLDNDRVERDLRTHLRRAYGPQACERYFEIFEALRQELGYADYLGALERYRIERLHDPRVLRMANWLVDYPFAERLYPGALKVVRHVRRWGRAVIFSDGDAVFQPRKVERSGLWQAFLANVLIYVHKEQMLADVEQRYPAQHYVMIDDKLRILTAIKETWGQRVTTVFPRQGHYARDRAHIAAYPAADLTVRRIGDLCKYDATVFLNSVPPIDRVRRRSRQSLRVSHRIR